MSTSKSQNGPMGQKRTAGLVSGSADKDHLDLEKPGDKGLMVASWGINRAKVPFGRLILKKEETYSLKVNEKGHKVKMKFIMSDFFFDFCFFK